MRKVVLFSGGRTSGLMLRKLIDSDPNFRSNYLVCFANTGKEKIETLDFVRDVETNWAIPIIWVEYHRVAARSLPAGVFPTPRRNQNLAKAAERNEKVHWFRQVSYETASLDGEPFNELLEWASVLPNVKGRICSIQLKVRTVMRYLFSTGISTYEAYIGIRADESIRSLQIQASCDDYEIPKFPLIEAGTTEEDVLAFWDCQPFDLQLKPHQGNCDLCFLKAKWKLVDLIRETPSSVDWWKMKESEKKADVTIKGRGAQFNRSYSYVDLSNIAESGVRVARRGKDIPCSCVERAFDRTEEII